MMQHIIKNISNQFLDFFTLDVPSQRLIQSSSANVATDIYVKGLNTGETYNLLLTNESSSIFSNIELRDYVNSGQVVFSIGSTILTTGDSRAYFESMGVLYSTELSTQYRQNSNNVRVGVYTVYQGEVANNITTSNDTVINLLDLSEGEEIVYNNPIFNDSNIEYNIGGFFGSGNIDPKSKYNFKIKITANTIDDSDLVGFSMVNGNTSIPIHYDDLFRFKYTQTGKFEFYVNNILVAISDDTYVGNQSINLGIKQIYSKIPSYTISTNNDVETPGNPYSGETFEYTSQNYIFFEGDNEYISLSTGSSLNNIVDWSQKWTIGVRFPEGLPTGNRRNTVWVNGDNFIGITYNLFTVSLYAGSSDMFVFNTNFINGSLRPSNNDLLFFEYDNLTNVLTLKTAEDRTLVDLNITSTNTGDPNKGIGGNNQMNENADYYAGSMDEMFVLNRILNKQEKNDINNNRNLANVSFYDDILEWWLMGEDVFPNVLGVKNISNGTFINGNNDNFKIISQ